jgi:hypothetical protein
MREIGEINSVNNQSAGKVPVVGCEMVLDWKNYLTALANSHHAFFDSNPP